MADPYHPACSICTVRSMCSDHVDKMKLQGMSVRGPRVPGRWPSSVPLKGASSPVRRSSRGKEDVIHEIRSVIEGDADSKV